MSRDEFLVLKSEFHYGPCLVGSRPRDQENVIRTIGKTIGANVDQRSQGKNWRELMEIRDKKILQKGRVDVNNMGVVSNYNNEENQSMLKTNVAATNPDIYSQILPTTIPHAWTPTNIYLIKHVGHMPKPLHQYKNDHTRAPRTTPSHKGSPSPSIYTEASCPIMTVTPPCITIPPLTFFPQAETCFPYKITFKPQWVRRLFHNNPKTSMDVISWNYQGIRSMRIVPNLKDLMRMYIPVIMFLMETNNMV